MKDQERLCWLQLYRSENIGPATFRDLLQMYGTAEHALAAIPGLSARGGMRRKLRVYPKDQARQELDTLARMNGHVLTLQDSDYPALLKHVSDGPPVLTVLGHIHLLHRPCVGIVGARNASLNGKKLAQSMAQALGQAGWVVASGLARGIDGYAHQGSLDTGTVAVIAGGPDVIYPPEHEALYRRVVDHGAVLSECAPGTQPLARHFPRRNRIISGLSRGVVVVEAAERSGSLITARMAADQGRDVMAVPGSPLDARCRGTNRLIRDGAFLVQEADDVLSILDRPDRLPLSEPANTEYRHAVSDEAVPEIQRTALRQRMLESLSSAPVSINAVIRDLEVPSATVLSLILELELAGQIVRQPGNLVYRVAFEEAV